MNTTAAIEMIEGCSQSPLFDDGVMVGVTVEAFGRELHFILDTGFSVSVIDIQYRLLLGPQAGEYSAINPVGGNSVVAVYRCPDLAIAGKPLRLDTVICLDLTMPRLISGRPCDGILGMDFFGGQIVSLNFDKNVFSFGGSLLDVARAGYRMIPLKCTSGHFTVETVFNRRRNIDLMIDIGDSSSVSLNPDDWREAFLIQSAAEVSATVASFGSDVLQTRVGVLEEVRIGNLSYRKLHATAIQNPMTLSHLGLGFFKRHNVIFDFRASNVFLQPGRAFLKPDREDMSGLHLIKEDQSIMVHSVDYQSPAFQEGVRAGDMVETVDGKDTAAMSLNEIRQILRSGEGKSVGLGFKRGTVPLRAVVKLKTTI